MSGRLPGIHTETFGSGPNLVMVHGWAMHSGVWREFAERLASEVRVTLVDLPGHGRSGNLPDFTLDAVADALIQAAPEGAHWLGWSLGALLALGCAARQRVASVTLMAGNPKFVAEAEWPGVSLTGLERVAAELEKDFTTTIKRFIGLQTFGLDNARALAKQIGGALDDCEPPTIEALRGGLEVLRQADLRESLRRADYPALAILGAHDRLVPKALAEALPPLAPRVEVQVLDTAAHLPFATHPEVTAHLILDFIRRHDR